VFVFRLFVCFPFLFVCFLSVCLFVFFLGTQTRALCLFVCFPFPFVCFLSVCLFVFLRNTNTCLMFVLLTITIPRSFYFTECEILTAVPNYWDNSFFGA